MGGKRGEIRILRDPQSYSGCLGNHWMEMEMEMYVPGRYDGEEWLATIYEVTNILADHTLMHRQKVFFNEG